MKHMLDKLQAHAGCTLKPMLRTYAPNQDGILVRIGRTYRNMGAALKVATTMSNSMPYVEVRNDAKPIRQRLVAIARKGMIINEVGQVDGRSILA